MFSQLLFYYVLFVVYIVMYALLFMLVSAGSMLWDLGLIIFKKKREFFDKNYEDTLIIATLGVILYFTSVWLFSYITLA